MGNTTRRAPQGFVLAKARLGEPYRPKLDGYERQLLADYRRREAELAAEPPAGPAGPRETVPRRRSGDGVPVNPMRLPAGEAVNRRRA